MKGVILAGGTGSRLWPLTLAVSKQLLPIYDKPMIYYPLSTLMLASIRQVLVITSPQQRAAFERLLGDGSRWGMTIEYAVQPKPEGIAQALIIGRAFCAGERIALALGDNLFFGQGLPDMLRRASARDEGATVFAYRVGNPGLYGVLELDENNRPLSIEEKPEQPKSRWAMTGLYFLDADAPAVAAKLSPSARGELEITDVANHYLESGHLHVERLGRGYAWLDAGTPDSLIEAAEFVRVVERRQDMKIACIEEVAFHMGFIDRSQLRALANDFGDSPYGAYLHRIAAK